MARRRRREKSNIVKDVFEITATFPWQVGVVLAVISYLLMRWLIAGDISPAANAQPVAAKAGWQLVRAFATVGQFVLPVLFLAGALGSFVTARRRARAESSFSPLYPASSDLLKEPSLGSDTDLYELWPGDSELYFDESNEPKSKPDRWSLDLLRRMDWKRFEEVSAEYFRLCGFHAKTQSHGADGGIDIRLFSPTNSTQVVNIVQCKQWAKPIGPKALRELLGVMTANKLSRGIFMTTSTFNGEATTFALENKIHLIDGAAFLAKILSRPEADRQRLLEVATEGDYLTPSCPSCGIKLAKRENKKDGSAFWGCTNYPRCRYTLRA